MTPRNPSVWRLIACATPPDLLVELLLHLLLHPGTSVPAELQRRLAEAWVRSA